MCESTESVVEEMIELESEQEPERDAETKSQFSNLYKYRNLLTQEERRRRYLEHIKLRRNQNIDKMRGLEDVLSEEFDENYMLQELEVQDEPMEIEVQHKKKRKHLRSKVMLSEWLIGRPDDLEENWVIKLCPTGKRCMIIAHNRITTAYNKYGKFIQKFYSNFPGGNKTTCSSKIYTVLDCVFNVQKQCFFVIDLLAWNGISFRDAGVECRDFWLKSKFKETEELEFTSEQNDYPFYYIETLSVDELEDQLRVPYSIKGDYSIKLDGILFYLKEVPYIMRVTPLVGWLKPFMVREILGIDVHHSFQAPPNYTIMQDYLATLGKRKNQHKERQKVQAQC